MIICKTSTEKIFLARTKELGITENITQVRHKIWISFNHTYCLSDQDRIGGGDTDRTIPAVFNHLRTYTFGTVIGN